MVDALEVLANCLADRDGFPEAARLLAAAESVRGATGYRFRAPTQQAALDAAIEALRSALGSDFDRAWSDGETMTADEACDYVARGRGERKRPPTGWRALTPMEAQVAALVSEGLTNVQVGERLFISRHTVDSHLRHIYAKLGVSNRAELATRVARRDGADA